MGDSNCLQIDESWFKKEMKEDKKQKNFPVEVKALKIRWLFQDDTG